MDPVAVVGDLGVDAEFASFAAALAKGRDAVDVPSAEVVAEERSSGVPSAGVDAATAIPSTEHVGGDVIILVHGLTHVAGDDGDLCLVEDIRAEDVCVLLLAPAYDGALVAHGERVGLLWEAGWGDARPRLHSLRQLQERHVVVDGSRVVLRVGDRARHLVVQLRTLPDCQVVLSQPHVQLPSDAVRCRQHPPRRHQRPTAERFVKTVEDDHLPWPLAWQRRPSADDA